MTNHHGVGSVTNRVHALSTMIMVKYLIEQLSTTVDLVSAPLDISYVKITWKIRNTICVSHALLDEYAQAYQFSLESFI